MQETFVYVAFFFLFHRCQVYQPYLYAVGVLIPHFLVIERNEETRPANFVTPIFIIFDVVT